MEHETDGIRITSPYLLIPTCWLLLPVLSRCLVGRSPHVMELETGPTESLNVDGSDRLVITLAPIVQFHLGAVLLIHWHAPIHTINGIRRFQFQLTLLTLERNLHTMALSPSASCRPL